MKQSQKGQGRFANPLGRRIIILLILVIIIWTFLHVFLAPPKTETRIKNELVARVVESGEEMTTIRLETTDISFGFLNGFADSTTQPAFPTAVPTTSSTPVSTATTTSTSTTTTTSTSTTTTTSTSTTTTTITTTDTTNAPITTSATKPKLVFGATHLWESSWPYMFNFTGCPHKCILKVSEKFEGVEQADLVMFGRTEWTKRFPNVSPQVRQKQYWIFITTESGVFPSHHLPEMFNGKFNATMMHRRDATIYLPYGKTEKLSVRPPEMNFIAGKTKGAFAYVSNCYNQNYERIGTMEELAKYIPVDIFSGPCKGKHVLPPPCPRGAAGSNQACETAKHKPYRFFLSFENTLCLDYITEKFWDRLESTSYFIPVALGGMTVQEYTDVSPPNSFIHVYNFTSIQKLGEHLKYLMENEEAFNRYHQWRYEYRINSKRNIAACDVCKLAHEQPQLPAIENIVAWRNNDSLCRTYKADQGS